MKTHVFMAAMTCALLTAAATAGIKTFNGSQSSKWNNGLNWTPNGVPGDNDRAVIPSPLACEIDPNDNMIADTINVQSGGSGPATLYIYAGGSLTLDNDSPNIADPDHSIVDGIVLLDGTETTGGKLIFTTVGHAISGTGSIDGYGVGCNIEIATAVTVYNGLGYGNSGAGKGIRGSYTVRKYTGISGTAPGNFKNQGRVHVGFPGASGGTIVFESDIQCQDVSNSSFTARWEGLNCRSSMTIKRDATGLNGHFDWALGCILYLFADVKTCGTFTYNGGGVTLSSGKTFKFAGFQSTLPCTPTLTGSGGCGANIYTLSSSHSCGACP